MATTPDAPRYALTVPAVRRSIETISQRRSHEQFPGYLLLHHLGVSRKKHVDSAELNRTRRAYLLVGGAPPTKPFLQAFKSRGEAPKLDNPNSAGSYGPKSIRPGQTLAKIVTTVKSGHTASGFRYRFRPDHASVALAVMLGGRRMPAAATAAFLLRDYGLAMDPTRPEQLVEIFRDWLGAAAGSVDAGTFETLFEDDSLEFLPEDFQPVEEQP